VSGHLAPFALQAAFPPSLAGRNSGDYYEASVALGLASRRRSHVRPCRTCQRDLGVPLISFNALTGHRSWLRRLHHLASSLAAEPAPVSGVFPADVNFHLLEIGIQAIKLSPYHAGPPEHRPKRLEPGLWLAGMLLSP